MKRILGYISPRRRLLTIVGAGVILITLIVLLTALILNGVSAVATILTPPPTATPLPSPTPSPLPTPSPTASPTPVPFVNGAAEYLVEADSDRALYSANIHARLQMGSTTKIMTAVVALENGNPAEVVPIVQSELDEVPPGVSTAQLVANDRMYLSDLLYALLLPSGCDAAIVIAHAVGGTTANFVAMMNHEAQQLGLQDTHYTSPYGALPDANQYTSVTDLVTLGRYAMAIPLFAHIVGQTFYELKATINHHDYPWYNTNNLLDTYPGADGIKTGNTSVAGYCLVFSATRNGRRLIGAELGAPDFPTLYSDATNLLNLGFSPGG
jgi:D-alanyl-D-alanine carboxypeptidase (penicillin-binding protein 5/6)